jgi:hypothetical protein
VRTFSFDHGVDPPKATEYERKPIDREYTLESWLHANPEMLLDESVFIFGRQYRLNAGLPDLLGLDRYGNVLVFELKKGQSGSGSASEGSILSQPQEYASELSTFDYHDLDDIYQEYRSLLADDEWELDLSVAPGDTLQDAYESHFGDTLGLEDFNTHQRMVIVAESITRQTEDNTRYLLEQGVNVQAVEVQVFSAPDQSDVLVTNTVVDYDTSRIRPQRRQSPRYPEKNRQIIERTFPKIESIVAARSPQAVFSDFDKRAPELHSMHADHPETVIYRLRVAPVEGNNLTPGNVHVRIDLQRGQTDEQALQLLRDNADRFDNQDFRFHDDRKLAIAYHCWDVEPARLDTDEFLEEIADRFAELVELGHNVLVEDDR